MVMGTTSTLGIKSIRQLNKSLLKREMPTGLYMMIDSGNCPSGWTEDTAFDTRYPYGANASIGSTGGSNTYAHSHSLGNRGSGTGVFSGAVQSTGTDSTIWYPPYVKVKFCKKN